MLTILKYHIPFKIPFKTASGSYSHRTGFLICHQEMNQFFWGEAAPLPGFSTESTEDISATLKHLKTDIGSFFLEPFDLPGLTTFINSISVAPSLQFALSYLGLTLLSCRKRCSIGELFGITSSKVVRINDVIGHMDTIEWKKAVNGSIAKGFSCIKMKALYPLNNLVQQLDDVHRNHDHVTFRLDANRSWPQDQTDQINRLIKHLPIEYIEEPFQQYGRELSAVLQNPFDFPIALDESVHNPERLITALKQPEQIVIIKPSLLGNLCEWIGTFQTYRGSYDNIVVTTALETAIGCTAAADVTALIGSRIRCHGLNTGKFFLNNVFQVQEIEAGRIHMPLHNLGNISPKHLNKEYISLSDL
jgi:o-succinylbenzoate synthase